MESIIYQLIDYIRQNMPEVSLVDEDYGQLEAIDKEGVDTYPVTFPCVLIDTPEAEPGKTGKAADEKEDFFSD